MAKVLLYAAWAIMITGVLINRFVYRFPDNYYFLFLGLCVFLGVAAYWMDRRSK